MATDVLTTSSAAPPDEGSVVNPRPVSLEHTDSVVLPAWPTKCDFVVKEILKTERDYVNSLEDILKGYKNPVAGHLQFTNEGHNFVTTVFCNLEQLYEIHRSFLDRLKLCESKPHEFGQAFSSAIEDFKAYTKYCTNYVKALQCLQQWLTTDKVLKSFIEECQHSLHHDIPLNFQLIKPVQRILKYHLLLKDLLKHFDQNHDGYNSLRSAYTSMVDIANHINEVQKRHDYDRKVQEIQSCLSGLGGRMPEGNLSAYGDLLHEGMCKVGKKGAERHVLLFEKLLLILKKKDAKHYTYKGHILRDELSLADDTRSGGSHVFKVFSRHHRNQSYAIHANTTLAKQEWVGKIRQLKEEESFEQEVKRRKLATVSEQQQTRLRDPKMHLASSRTKRMTPRKKRERRDVRSLFSHDEGAPELTSFKRVAADSLTSIPEDRTTVQVEVSFPVQTILTEDSGFVSSVGHSKSVDSCLSLSDVEIGLEDSGHFGEFEEVDSPHVVELSPHVPQQKSNLKRRTTIRVKRASRVNPPLKAMLAREPKEDEPVDMIDGDDFEEEDSQVKGMLEMGFDSPGDSVLGGTNKGFSQGQSVDGMPNGIVENEQGIQEVPPTANQSQHASGSARIVADGGEEIFPEDAAVPVSMEGEEEEEEGEEGDFVIMEDSSDSEDEEEEDESLVEDVTVDLGTSVDKEDIADNELQQQTDTLEGRFESTDQEVPKEGANVLTDKSLSTLDERAVPSEGEGSQLESAAPKQETEDEQEDTVTKMETPQRSGMDSLAFKGVTDIYGTVPRRQHRKSASPHPNTPSIIDSSRRSGSAHALSQTTPDAQSRRALRFFQLLEFTKQQCSPVQNLKSVNVTESLPILGQRPFSPEREEERMTVPDESTTLLLENKKLEFSEQGDVEEEVPKVTHIIPSVNVEEPDFQAEKQEFSLTTVDNKEAGMETETSTDATTNGNAVAAERENLEEDKHFPTPAPDTSGPEYELRMRSQSQQNQPSVTENHLTPKLNGEQTMAVEPSGGVFGFMRSSHRGGLWPSMLYWGLVIVGIGIAVYLGYNNYAYSAGGSSKPL